MVRQLGIQNTTTANLTSWSVDLEFDGITKFGTWGGTGAYDLMLSLWTLIHTTLPTKLVESPTAMARLA